jgi:hypothetical protein
VLNLPKLNNVEDISKFWQSNDQIWTLWLNHLSAL